MTHGMRRGRSSRWTGCAACRSQVSYCGSERNLPRSLPAAAAAPPWLKMARTCRRVPVRTILMVEGQRVAGVVLVQSAGDWPIGPPAAEQRTPPHTPQLPWRLYHGDVPRIGLVCGFRRLVWRPRIHRHNLASHEPFEQVTDRGKPRLDGRGRVLLRLHLDPLRDVKRLHGRDPGQPFVVATCRKSFPARS